MSDKETPILRLGEWLEINAKNYVSFQNVWTPGSSGAGAYPVQLELRAIEQFNCFDLIRMFKDYDKYLDGQFNL